MNLCAIERTDPVPPRRCRVETSQRGRHNGDSIDRLPPILARQSQTRPAHFSIFFLK